MIGMCTSLHARKPRTRCVIRVYLVCAFNTSRSARQHEHWLWTQGCMGMPDLPTVRLAAARSCSLPRLCNTS